MFHFIRSLFGSREPCINETQPQFHNVEESSLGAMATSMTLVLLEQKEGRTKPHASYKICECQNVTITVYSQTMK